ncbi:hypothetical protein Tco_0314627, partial [Tanacetum coccineum]
MLEELHEFERLEVWELVPPPDKTFVITLKWIYKVKLDELGGILKNKARLVDDGNIALNLVTQWILPWWRNPNWMRIKKGTM